MAARNPAPPPPTTSTSHAKTSIGLFEDQRRGPVRKVDLFSESAGDPMTPPPRQLERIMKGLPILKAEITSFRRSLLGARVAARAFAWPHLTQRTTTWQTKPIESNVTVWAKCVYRPTPSTVPKRSEPSTISR